MSECFLYSPDTLKGVSSQIPDRSTDATQIIRFPDYEKRHRNRHSFNSGSFPDFIPFYLQKNSASLYNLLISSALFSSSLIILSL